MKIPPPSISKDHQAAIAKACRLIQSNEQPLHLAKLAGLVGISPFHFHRLFKAATGLTPKDFALAYRSGKVREKLARSPTITEAIYEAGFNSNGRFYAQSNSILGMTPTSFRKGGIGATIHFAVGECSSGSVLVAATEKGVCAIFLGDDPDLLVRNLQDRFPRAQFIGGDAEFEKLVAKVIGFIESPRQGWNLPLDVRGTIFQQRVWKALQEIPLASTASYTEIAARIGLPKAVRAVAGACAANPIAVVIPCHRVLRHDGNLSGYRWGIERKQALLNLEKSYAPIPSSNDPLATGKHK